MGPLSGGSSPPASSEFLVGVERGEFSFSDEYKLDRQRRRLRQRTC